MKDQSCPGQIRRTIKLDPEVVWTIGEAKLWLDKNQRPLRVSICFPEEIGVCKSRNECLGDQLTRKRFGPGEVLAVGKATVFHADDTHRPASLLLCHELSLEIAKTTT